MSTLKPKSLHTFRNLLHTIAHFFHKTRVMLILRGHDSPKRGNYMPTKAKRPCIYPGCPELSDGRYCDKHQRKVNGDYNRFSRDDDSKRFYKSPAWRRLSALQLKREPLCAKCLKAGRVTPAAIADHYVPIRDGGERIDMANLRSLCRACHIRKHNANFRE